MIPIPIEECIKIDVESEKNENYKTLLHKQINWCNKKENIIIILNKANKIYAKKSNKKLPQRIIDRCCDFRLLEQKSKNYKKINKKVN
ncbi:MAG: type III toxin-antitoxin system ToxN/AbiQ family toxin [Clostridia bacterium]|nr:type III toxin-antitoxin system ToxN/AbiQ family toxin [Clostridia bacterium]